MQSRIEVSDPAFDFVRPDSQHYDFDDEERHFDSNEVFVCGLVLSQKNVRNEEDFVGEKQVHLLNDDVQKSEGEPDEKEDGDDLEVMVGHWC